MADGQVQLAYTEWTLVELGGAPVEVGPDERLPQLVLDLEEAHVSGSGGVNRIHRDVRAERERAALRAARDDDDGRPRAGDVARAHVP